MIIEAADKLQEIKEYYFAGKLREIRQRMAAGEDIINLGIGSPDMTPSASTIAALLNYSQGPGNHGYQPYKGIPALREAYAKWYLATYQVSLDPTSDLLPLIGSKEGIMHISMAFLNPGDEVLVPNPGYPTYTSVSKINSAAIRYYELDEADNWRPNLAALEAEGLEKVKLMWINYPHMPTGTPPNYELFEQLVAFAKRNRILLCHDNPYSLVLNEKPMSIFSVPGAKEVALELNSLSKSHNMAGWRMGILSGAKDYIDTVMRVKSNMDSGMFQPMQHAAVAALNNSSEWHDQRNEIYETRRVWARAILASLNCSFSMEQSGMFLWAKIPAQYTDGQALSEAVLNGCHVFITPGFIFGSKGEGYVRISLCTPADRLEEAHKRISEWVKNPVSSS